MTRRRLIWFFLAIALLTWVPTWAAGDLDEAPQSPARSEGEGPFGRSILRGVTLIDGTGAPARGPVDIVVEGNKIERIENVGVPGVTIDPRTGRRSRTGTRYSSSRDTTCYPASSISTDISADRFARRRPSTCSSSGWRTASRRSAILAAATASTGSLDHKRRSAANEITAPRHRGLLALRPGSRRPHHHCRRGTRLGPERGLPWSRRSQALRSAARPDGSHDRRGDRLGLYTTCHHAQLNVVWQNALDSARMGLTSMQHWYGLPEAMFTDRVSQNYPAAYDYNNEQDRFSEAGRLWKQAAPPFSDKWNEVMDELVELDFTIVPTFVPTRRPAICHA